MTHNISFVVLVLSFSFILIMGCSREGPTSSVAEHESPLEILEDYESLNTPFIVLNITDSENHATIAILNEDLFYTYREILSLSQEHYVNDLSSIITENRSIVVSRRNMRRLRPYTIEYHPRVDSLASIGDEQLIRHYFNLQGLSRVNFEPKEKGMLIRTLFERGIFVTVHHFSGRLALYSSVNFEDT